MQIQTFIQMRGQGDRARRQEQVRTGEKGNKSSCVARSLALEVLQREGRKTDSEAQRKNGREMKIVGDA